MNYPIWTIPAPGLLIAGIAVLHVFVSHFAIGGGLFLVWYELRARRASDPALLDYVRRHSRFFLLATLVLGALTGVGIWFTIGLVHPQATSTLIQNFVWLWAIEWTFFAVEIAAALVYYYGWRRMTARLHLAVGGIYFVAAWMSLFTINGILTFMMTPGQWVETGSLFDAFFNPTFWPSLATRTLIAIGLAGLYALLTASFLATGPLRARIIREAALLWLLPAGILLPVGFGWYLSSAAEAGIPVAEVFGAPGADLASVIGSALSGGSTSGYPPALTATLLGSLAFLLIAAAAVALGLLPGLLRRPLAVALMFTGLLAFAGFEWVREDLRKPYVIGRHMFVNGIRLQLHASAGRGTADPFSKVNLDRQGILATARWSPPGVVSDEDRSEGAEPHQQGREIFKLLCSGCHTLDGHLGMRPLVTGQPASAIREILRRLAQPVDQSGQPTSWEDPGLRLTTWRGRRMPPFAGTDQERESLARYLSALAGAVDAGGTPSDEGGIFEERCGFCHGPEADWPMQRVGAGKDVAEFFDLIGRLPEVNPIMPPFDGTEAERRLLAAHLAELVREPGLQEED